MLDPLGPDETSKALATFLAKPGCVIALSALDATQVLFRVVKSKLFVVVH